MSLLKKLFGFFANFCSSDSLRTKRQPNNTQNKDTFYFDSIYKPNGPLRSTKDWTGDFRTFVDVNFHFRESSQISLTFGSSPYEGDYMEFGSHDLNTFRNMLSAYNISGQCQAYKDVRFYAFDIFGKLDAKDAKLGSDVSSYFSPYSGQGDKYHEHLKMIQEHGLYVDQCILVQGLFEKTLTKDFKTAYLNEKREVGFAFVDCNIGSSYRSVFEFIFPLLAENSYIYMDEYFQNPDVVALFNDFCANLKLKRKMMAVFIRCAGGFGALFRLCPIHDIFERPYHLGIYR